MRSGKCCLLPPDRNAPHSTASGRAEFDDHAARHHPFDRVEERMRLEPGRCGLGGAPHASFPQQRGCHQ
jgi:hypothetical protein